MSPKRTAKDDKILELQYNNAILEQENEDLHRDLIRVSNELYEVHRKPLFKRIREHRPRYAADIALDVWPLRDWFRLSYSPWRPGQYLQIVIGPIRIEVYAA